MAKEAKAKESKSANNLMSFNGWGYYKPVGKRSYHKKLDKEIAGIEKYDYRFETIKNVFQIVKTPKAIQAAKANTSNIK